MNSRSNIFRYTQKQLVKDASYELLRDTFKTCERMVVQHCEEILFSCNGEYEEAIRLMGILVPDLPERAPWKLDKIIKYFLTEKNVSIFPALNYLCRAYPNYEAEILEATYSIFLNTVLDASGNFTNEEVARLFEMMADYDYNEVLQGGSAYFKEIIYEDLKEIFTRALTYEIVWIIEMRFEIPYDFIEYEIELAMMGKDMFEMEGSWHELFKIPKAYDIIELSNLR